MKTLDPIERKKLWAQMDDAARRLGIPPLPRLHIGMLVEKDGKILTKNREEGHSWTRNGWNFAFATASDCAGDGTSTFGAGYMSAKRTTGTIYGSNAYRATVYNNQAAEGFIASAGVITNGIVVGTGDTAFSAEQYAMATIVEHGNGSGQMAYQEQTWPSLDYTGTTWTATLSRVMNNNSGDSISIKEVGLYKLADFFTTSTCVYLFARDVLGSPVSVANGAQLTVTYEISMDFSSIDT